MTSSPLRIAMWSGPRNISTAMMRSWENRADTFVSDEPFYAHYLEHTKLEHPGRDQITTSQPTDWKQVVNKCLTDTHNNCSIHYQKHMTQHMLSHIDLTWLESLRNIFLIRAPDAVVSSYSKSRPDLNAADLGFEQQARIFNHVRQHIDARPMVIESSDLLDSPKQAMKIICQHLNIAFDNSMMQWPAGKRDSDGIWAPYWYKKVEQSTGFAKPIAREVKLDPSQKTIADQCQPYYELLAAEAVQL